jgi:hypothetical protein
VLELLLKKSGLFGAQLKKLKDKFRQSVLLSRRAGARKGGSLVKRIQVLLLAWGLVVYIMAVAGFWYVSSHVIQTTFQQQALSWLEKLDELSTPLYVSQDVKEFATIEAHIKSFSEIAYIRFYNANGVDVLAEYSSQESPSLEKPDFNSKVFKNFSSRELKDGKAIIQQLSSDNNLLRVVAPVAIVSMQADEMLSFDMDSQHE